MKIGIVGLPKSGKATLMGLLTQTRGDSVARTHQSHVGIMEIPDSRVDWLSELYRPRKTIYARMEVSLIRPYKGRELLSACRDLDALVAILPAFMAETSDLTLGFLDSLETEFIIADLALIEGRFERLEAHKARVMSQAETPFLEKCRAALEDGVPLNKVSFEPHETSLLTTFAFFTRRPMVLAVNVSGDALAGENYVGRREVEARAQANGYPVVVFSGEVEPEIALLPEEERLAFLQVYGLRESGVSRIAKAAYRCLGLISFFTVGDDEVRAWSIREGIGAREAAGKIHSDLERGFIRAEVVSYEDLARTGSMVKAKEKGLVRVEGRDYLIQDGDVVNVRFSV